MTKQLPVDFILGFIRSGSTLLMTLCREHPDIETDVAEPNHIYRLIHKTYLNYENYRKVVGMGAGDVEKMFFNSIKAFTQTFYRQLCNRTKTSHVVVKHPWLTQEMETLVRVFDKAKVLVLLRHPYDVIASAYHFTYLTKSAEQMCGGKGNLKHIIDLYTNAMAKVIKVEPYLANTNRFLKIKYEDLITTPKPILTQTYKFFGASHDDKVVDGVLKRAQANEASLVKRCLSRSDIYKPKNKFQEMLNDNQKHLIRCRTKPFLQAFGYKDK